MSTQAEHGNLDFVDSLTKIMQAKMDAEKAAAREAARMEEEEQRKKEEQEEDDDFDTKPGMRRAASTGSFPDEAGCTGSSMKNDEHSGSEDGFQTPPPERDSEASPTPSELFRAGLRQKEKKLSFIIEPKNTWKVRWDMLIGVFIVYTVLVLPWRIGFDTDASGAMMIFDYVLDGLFGIDTVLSFITAYYTGQDVLIVEPYKIARRYATTFMVPDILSWFPLTEIVVAAVEVALRVVQFSL